MEWDGWMATRQAKYPNENFVRFVAKNYYDVPDRSKVRFLDLGCGAGANTWYLAHEGFRVTAVDRSESALASLRHRFQEERFPHQVVFLERDINHLDVAPACFDCVLDHNTLCHIEKPPFDAIHDALKDGGRFFSVAPALDTWRGTLEGKGFCRVASEHEVREMLKMFSDVKIRHSSYPAGDHDITSWIIEATK